MTKYELENALEQERKINENLRTQLKTAQETIEHLRNEINNLSENQIPKKPKKLTYKILIDSGWEYECPNCGLAVGKNKYTDYEYLEEYEDYCQNCGQALDWSDTE